MTFSAYLLLGLTAGILTFCAGILFFPLFDKHRRKSGTGAVPDRKEHDDYK